MEDQEIVALFWNRSERAFEETEKKYGRYCRTIAGNILTDPEDIQECINDGYFGVWKSIPPSRPEVFKTFLGKIIRRTALKRWRDQTREKRGGGQIPLALEELKDCIAGKMTVEDHVLSAELTEIINEFLESLPVVERQLFLRRYWYLDSVETLSRNFAFSQAKVKSMLYRTRKKLRNRLIQEGR